MITNMHFIDKKAHLNVRNIHFVEDFTIHRKENNNNLGEFVNADLVSNLKCELSSIKINDFNLNMNSIYWK